MDFEVEDVIAQRLMDEVLSDDDTVELSEALDNKDDDDDDDEDDDDSELDKDAGDDEGAGEDEGAREEEEEDAEAGGKDNGRRKSTADFKGEGWFALACRYTIRNRT